MGWGWGLTLAQLHPHLSPTPDPTRLVDNVKIKFVENYFFLANYFAPEGAVSHKLSPLLVTKVRFYANNYFE